MSVLKTVWLFKERFNKVDSNHYRDLSPIQIDQFINNAVFIFLENNVFPELNQQKFDMVSNLIVTQPEQSAVTPVSTDNNVYEFDLSTLVYPYLHYKRAYVKTNCGTYDVEIVGQGRLNDILRGNFQKPSKKWKRLIGSFAKNSTSNSKSLYIYSEEGFEIESLYLEYVRQPKEFFSGGYNSIEFIECQRSGGVNCNNLYYNASSPTQDLEIDSTYHTLIVDYAVKEASRILKDGDSLNLNADKINSINS